MMGQQRHTIWMAITRLVRRAGLAASNNERLHVKGANDGDDMVSEWGGAADGAAGAGGAGRAPAPPGAVAGAARPPAARLRRAAVPRRGGRAGRDGAAAPA